jgi:tetratricopeptide (TPR) repeat protein
MPLGEAHGRPALQKAELGRVSSPAGGAAARVTWASVLLVAGLLLTIHPMKACPLAQQTEAPKPKQSVATDSDMAEARRLAQQGKFDEAIARLEGIASNHPDTKMISHELGVVYYKKGDYVKAAASFKKALEEDPADNEATQLMGLSFYLAGRPAEAIAPLEKVQGWYPSANVDAAYILGVCYMQTKDYPRARKAFARMFGVPEDSAAGYLFTARMLLRQDLTPVAEE